MGIQVAQNDRGASTHHHKQVLCAILSLLPCSMVDLVSKNSRFLGYFQDNRAANSAVVPRGGPF